jgi:hypothetical protein
VLPPGGTGGGISKLHSFDINRLTAIRGTARTVSLWRYAAHVKGKQVGPGSSVSRNESSL